MYSLSTVYIFAELSFQQMLDESTLPVNGASPASTLLFPLIFDSNQPRQMSLTAAVNGKSYCDGTRPAQLYALWEMCRLELSRQVAKSGQCHILAFISFTLSIFFKKVQCMALSLKVSPFPIICDVCRS